MPYYTQQHLREVTETGHPIVQDKYIIAKHTLHTFWISITETAVFPDEL